MIKQILRVGFLLKIISLVRGNYKRLAFLLIGFGVISYLNSQAVEYFKLTDQQEYLSTVLLIKNLGYLIVASIFVLWPLLLSDKKPNVVYDDNFSSNPDFQKQNSGDGFDEIRSKEKVRSAAEIELDKIKLK